MLGVYRGSTASSRDRYGADMKIPGSDFPERNQAALRLVP
jgi:hypothetical protein